MTVFVLSLSLSLFAGGVPATPCADLPGVDIPAELLAAPPEAGVAVLTERGWMTGGVEAFTCEEGALRIHFTHSCCFPESWKEDIIMEECQGGQWVFLGTTCKATPNCPD